MRFLKQGYVWQFAGGFALGALALVMSQSPEGRHTLTSHFEHVVSRG